MAVFIGSCLLLVTLTLYYVERAIHFLVTFFIAWNAAFCGDMPAHLRSLTAWLVPFTKAFLVLCEVAGLVAFGRKVLPYLRPLATRNSLLATLGVVILWYVCSLFVMAGK